MMEGGGISVQQENVVVAGAGAASLIVGLDIGGGESGCQSQGQDHPQDEEKGPVSSDARPGVVVCGNVPPDGVPSHL